MKKMTVLATALTSGVGKAVAAVPDVCRRPGVVRVAADTAYPPIVTVKDDCTFEGFGVDITQALGERKNLDFTTSHQAFETVITSRQAEKVGTLRQLCGHSLAVTQATVNGADQAVEK